MKLVHHELNDLQDDPGWSTLCQSLMLVNTGNWSTAPFFRGYTTNFSLLTGINYEEFCSYVLFNLERIVTKCNELCTALEDSATQSITIQRINYLIFSMAKLNSLLSELLQDPTIGSLPQSLQQLNQAQQTLQALLEKLRCLPFEFPTINWVNQCVNIFIYCVVYLDNSPCFIGWILFSSPV